MDNSGVIIEYITAENVENYPYINEDYKKMLLDGLIDNIKLERKVIPEVRVEELVHLEEYRLRRKKQRQKKRRDAREFKRKALISEAEIEGTLKTF